MDCQIVLDAYDLATVEPVNLPQIGRTFGAI